MIRSAYTDVGVYRRPELPEIDVRHRLDEAVRRGWQEIARRVTRRGILVAVDLLATAVAAFLATAVLRRLPVPIGVPLRFGWDVVAFLLIIQPLALGVFGSYGGGALRVEFSRIARAVLTAALLFWVYSRLPTTGVAAGMSGLGTALYAAWAIGLIFASRLVVDELVAFAYDLGIGQRRVLVVGTAAEARKVTEMLGYRRGSDIKIVGLLSPSQTRQSGAVGTVAELEEGLRSTGARGIIVASNLSFEAFETLIRQCFEAGAAVSVLPGRLNQFRTKLDLRRARAGVLFELQPRGLWLPQLAVKRALDISLSLIALLLASPFYLLIALAIKLDSRGPVFFKQWRAGIGGQPFRMYKFRTMVADADRLKAQLQHLNGSGDPRLFKIKGDPRVTRVGRFLRKTSLDELPQLLNVLRGEMSVVGPRPFFPDDLKTYEPHHFERLSVLPGITGLWQVSGRSDIVDFEEVVRLDSEYIRNWSIGRDLVILIKTVPAAFGRGAY
jgi:exopolysaccharide biosynthesis polyprenyl glycosylphosphotransferase